MKVLRLHLDLETKYADMSVLRKWGKVRDGISRDIVVVPEMTLHALHYAVQRCFGWCNSHLHHFELSEAALHGLVRHRFMDYVMFCGLYFRFPYGDAVMEDIYWDDDYDGWERFKTWLKRKYNPPFEYGGSWELYSKSQIIAQHFLEVNKELEVGPSFDEYRAGVTATKRISPREADYEMMNRWFDYRLGELIERAQIGEFLRPLGTYINAAGVQESREDSIEAARQRALTLTAGLDAVMPPIAEELIYKYDYGDDWIVRITVADGYNAVLKGESLVGFLDKDGKEVEAATVALVSDVLSSGKPKCIAADGLPVMDNVGGIMGYCEFLKALHSGVEDAGEMREWAKGMDWTGRMQKPENIL